MTDLKSLAHPDWPYTGTPWEWRGFVKKTPFAGMPWPEGSIVQLSADEFNKRFAVYQKQNFGPELK
jgi:hypothetical protein